MTIHDEEDEKWTHERLVLIDRIATKATSQDPDFKLMQDACRRYLQNEGMVSLERCLGIPNTFKEWRLQGRDHYLKRAARAMLHADPNARCADLARAWNSFAGDGRYAAWRDDDGPPDYVSALSRELFYATRYAKQEGSAARQGNTLTVRHLSRVVGHIFSEKCRP